MTKRIPDLLDGAHVLPAACDLSNYQVAEPSVADGVWAAMRCPHCGKNGTFPGWKGLGFQQKVTVNQIARVTAAPSICPNPECSGVVFIVSMGPNRVITFPNETIDFDATGLPGPVLAALVEAIKCHAAGCYRAAALMVRRTLEEVCLDRDAGGKDLKKRIEALGERIVLPKELLEATDQLRLLGNDAAHIEARVYEQIGKEEVEIAIELAKEVLKAAYQYVGLLARLKGLRKPDGKAEGGAAATA